MHAVEGPTQCRDLLFTDICSVMDIWGVAEIATSCEVSL
jgi:hypothetical protein